MKTFAALIFSAMAMTACVGVGNPSLDPPLDDENDAQNQPSEEANVGVTTQSLQSGSPSVIP
jgi:hypothetical protein